MQNARLDESQAGIKIARRNISNLRYSEELYKKDLNDPDKHNGVITHLEPDILECEMKWTLGSINTNKANGGDGIPAELFQILKDDAVNVLHSICQQIWKTQQWPQDWKRSVFIPIPKKGNTKESSNDHTTVLISYASKVMLKILQARLQQYMNQEIPAELFKILKDNAVKVLHSICQPIWKTHQWPQDWKRSVFIPIPKKGNTKECSNYHTIALISHTRKVMFKILQARLQ